MKLSTSYSPQKQQPVAAAGNVTPIQQHSINILDTCGLPPMSPKDAKTRTVR